ncbi:MAG: FAD:protein FMN transferase, partial [Kiloniellales bacterium]|nr:FAD:protein FMN transferase [Kiloniellales bacterium]
GRIDRPPPELVELLARAQSWSRRTHGAFDVTVQPLWALYRRHFARQGADPDGPPPRAVEAAAALVDYRALAVAPDRIRLLRPGMAVTVNGIAQGYITDRVAELLRAQGLDRVLVALGEMRAMGSSADGLPWRVGLRAPGEPDGVSGRLALADAALATSSAAGLRFDSAGRFHHLFDPRKGGCAGVKRTVSVVAERACDADALSTAWAVAGRLGLSERALRDLGVRQVSVAEAGGGYKRLL